jgi:hypothetical protein
MTQDLSPPQPDSPFLPSNPRLQYAWDSTSLSTLLKCPRQYQLSILEGWQPKSAGYAIALRFGIAFHTALETYHRLRATGIDHEQALLTIVSTRHECPDYSTLPTCSEVQEADEATDGADDGINLRNSKIRTRYHLMRAVVWYLEHYANDPCQTLLAEGGNPAVEVSFRIDLPVQHDGTDLLLCGHMDRVVSFNDEYWVLDYKTTKQLSRQFFQDFQLSHQLSGYTLAGQVIFQKPVRGAIIDGIGLQVQAVQFERAFSRRTDSQLGEYIQTISFAFEQAQRFAETLDDYPMNTSACYFCQYKEVCSQPPEYRQTYLKMLFEQKPAWNPLRNR